MNIITNNKKIKKRVIQNKNNKLQKTKNKKNTKKTKPKKDQKENKYTKIRYTNNSSKIRHKKNNSEKGFFFTTDVIVAFVIVLFSLLVFSLSLSNNFNLKTQNEIDKFLEEKTIFLADAFIKNYNEKNSMTGACFFDEEKRRVRSNEINSALFSNIKSLNLETFFVKEIKIINSSKIIYLANKNSKKCLSVRRMALVDGIKRIIEFRGCLSE